MFCTIVVTDRFMYPDGTIRTSDLQSELRRSHRVPTHPEMSWKVMENDCGRGKSWKSYRRIIILGV